MALWIEVLIADNWFTSPHELKRKFDSHGKGPQSLITHKIILFQVIIRESHDYFWFDLQTRLQIEQRAQVVCVYGGVMVPPSAQNASTKPQPQWTTKLFSTETSKKRRPCVKLCKIRLYSFLFFFFPASSPFIITIIITIIVVNIIFEHITHQRQTAREHCGFSKRLAAKTSWQKQASAISTVPQHNE